MKRSSIQRSLALICLGATLHTGCGDFELDALEGTPADPNPTDITVADGEEIIADTTRIVGGVPVRRLKIRTPDGRLTARALDLDGAPIDLDTLPIPTSPLVHPDVAAALAHPATHPHHIGAEDTLPVFIGLLPPPDRTDDTPDRSGDHIIDEDGRYAATLDGEPLTLLDEGLLLAERAEAAAAHRRVRSSWRATQWQTLAARHGITDPGLSEAIAHGLPSIELSLTRPQIEAIARDSADLIAGIEPRALLVDDLAQALRDTAIDPVVLGTPARQGDGVGLYQSETGCGPDNTLANYDRLAGADDDHARIVARTLREVAPRAFIYCRAGGVVPRDSDLDGVGGNDPIMVENHSWSRLMASTNGVSHGTDEYLLLDRDFDDHAYDDNILVVTSAGNYGTIANDRMPSPGKSFNLLTVGAYNDATDTIAPSSSWRNAALGNEKPELSAPGVDLIIPGFAHFGALTGTSLSSPIVAGAAADIMGAYNWLRLRPAYLKAFLLAGATDAIAGGRDKVGVGGLDFRSAYFDGTNSWWDAANDSFDRYDDRDVTPGNGAIDRRFDVDATRFSRVRVALSWMTRGSYTHAHRADLHPIGRDLDIEVLDPAGNIVGVSSSFDDPFEVVDFAPARSGTYTVRIRDFDNRDRGARLQMGLAINYY